MSDDLISRKALLDRFRYGDKESESDKAWICAVRRMIKEQPTAFDKEKVKIQIKNKAGIGMCQEKKCKKYNNDCDECRVETAIEIVEKGGVE